MAYGVTLPLVPGLVERADVGAVADVGSHTGWITGVYTLALFLFGPAWGRLRIGSTGAGPCNRTGRL